MSEDYFKIGASIPRGAKNYVMSRTDLLMFWDNPAAWIEGRKFAGSPSTEWGSLVDCMVLTPAEFPNRYAIRPTTYYSHSKRKELPWNSVAKGCKQWAEEQKKAGKLTIAHREWEAADTARRKILAHPDAAYLLSNSTRRQVICRWEWKDPATGINVPLKCMLDMVGDHPWLADLKTGRRVDKDSFRKSGVALRYDIQVAMYVDGFRETHEERTDWYFLCQDSEPPYPVQVYAYDAANSRSGWDGYETRWGQRYPGYPEMLARYARCLEENKWPGYSEQGTDSIEFFGKSLS